MNAEEPPLAHRLAHAGLDWIVPDWPAPARIQALMTTRNGGVTTGARATMDVGSATSRDPDVIENRRRLRAHLPGEPRWLRQVHGTGVVHLDSTSRPDTWPAADAAVTTTPGVVCAVRVADCLPVFIADAAGTVVAVAHAGWRGLAAGVLIATIAMMKACAGESHRLLAWLGPAIGPGAFEVGPEVREAFCASTPAAAPCFTPGARAKWQADLYGLAMLQLRAAGVAAISGGGFCTYTETGRFFSYRRERDTGRMAALIWLAS